MGKLNTHSPINNMKDKWDTRIDTRHTVDRMYLTSLLETQYFQKSLYISNNRTM